MQMMHVSWSDVLFWPAGSRGENESGDMDSRRIVRYPDSHQLFVGNLPHDIDESELKEFFMSMFPRKKQHFVNTFSM